MRKLSTLVFVLAVFSMLGAGELLGQATRLVIRAGTDSIITVAAGAKQNLTITAKTASGATDITYAGAKTLTFSGATPSSNPVTPPTVSNSSGAATSFGSATTLNFVAGVATVTDSSNGVMRLYDAGTSAISAQQGSLVSAGNDRLTVTVNPLALSKFEWTLVSPQRNGIAFTGTNRLTAEDAYGNPVAYNAASNPVTVTSTFGGTVSGLGSGNNNVLNRAGDFSGGVADLTADGMTYTGLGGTGTFTATGGGSNGTSGSFRIVAGPATRLVVRTAAGDSSVNLTAGAAQNLRIIARDASGNTDTTYAGNKPLTFSGPGSSLSPVTVPTVTNNAGTQTPFGTSTTLNFVNGEASVSGSNNGVMRLYRAQSAIVSVTDGSLSSGGTDRLTVNVSATTLDKFAWVLASPQVSGVPFTGADTLKAQDDWGNTVTSFNAATTNVTVTTSLSGTVSGLGSPPGNVLNQSSDFSSGIAILTGKMTYTGTSGAGTFTATGGIKSGTSSSVTVNAGAATRFVLRTASVGDSVISLPAGVAQGLRITALDASGNVATGYTPRGGADLQRGCRVTCSGEQESHRHG